MLVYHLRDLDSIQQIQKKIKDNKRLEKKMIDLGEEVAPGIVVIDGVIDNCEYLLEKTKSMEHLWQKATIHLKENELGFGVEQDIRNADDLDISVGFEKDVEWFVLSKTVWSYADLYGKKYQTSFSYMEPMQMLRYEVNSGHYKAHSDSGPSSPRVFSSVLYLNDVEVGGETVFEKFDVSVKPKAGRLTIFPANFMYRHKALPPISNKKFCAVSWFVP
jgi:hypothetical protein